MNYALKNFQKTISEKTAAIIVSDVNRFYLTSKNISDGILVITNEQAFALYDMRCIGEAEKSTDGYEIILYKSFNDFKKLISSLEITALALEYDYISVSEFRKFSDLGYAAEDISDKLKSLRIQKLPYEIERIKKAQEITDLTFENVLKYIKDNYTNGLSEKQVSRFIEIEMLKNGASDKAFDTICVSGINTSMPHGIPSDKIIRPGEFITMDFGAKYEGYCSDMTRTICIGSASDEMRDVYETVLSAQERALEIINTGITGFEADSAAREIIEKKYSGSFGHALGHGLGIEIHENGGLTRNMKNKLLENTVTSVEPGIYLPGKFGVRIEDIVVICGKYAENLTKSPKNLIIL